jgi:hypothetical protein
MYVVAYLQNMSRQSPGDTEENYEMSRYATVGQGTYLIQAKGLALFGKAIQVRGNLK